MLAQITPVGIVGGFVLVAVLSTLLANTAAYYVTGESQLQRSVLPGVAVGLCALLAAALPDQVATFGVVVDRPAVVIPIALVTDAVAVWIAYGLDRRGTAMVTVAHYTLLLVVNFVVQRVLAIYQTAPG